VGKIFAAQFLRGAHSPEIAMSFYAGFDTANYPGNAQMDWLKANTNLSWCGYYLAPAPSHSSTTWMSNRSYLSANGWGILPVYLGQQTTGPGSHNVTAAQGQIDGANAASLARGDGFVAGTAIFLDIEDGSALTADATAYIQNWAQGVVAGDYQPGFYCSHMIASQVAAAMAALKPALAARIWVYKVPTVAQHAFAGNVKAFSTENPADAGYPAACAWQDEQNAVLTLPGAPLASMVVDLSTSTLANPGAAA
jgi:hypothetical protein